MGQKERTILIVGGGIAGMTAALHVAEAGLNALVIDNEPVIGGSLPLLDKTFPTDSCGVCFLAPKQPAICPFFECERHPNIQLRPATTIEGLTGQPGAFKATLRSEPRYVNPDRCTGCGRCVESCPVTVNAGHLGAAWPGETRQAIFRPFPLAVPDTFVIDPEACTFCGDCVPACPYDAIDLNCQPETNETDVDAVILAPGFDPNDAHVRGAYGYGEYADVISSLEYERMLSTSGPSRGRPVRLSDGRPANRIAIIHCVGSRDPACGLPYCSATCCMIAAKQASLTNRRNQAAEVALFTMDVRAAGRGYEHYMARVQNMNGVHYHRSLVSAVKLDPASGGLRLQFTRDGRPVEELFDLVVLQVGMVVPTDVQQMAARLGVTLNEYGFADTADGLPVNTSRPGVFVAGAFREPKDVPTTITEAIAAAAQALAFKDESFAVMADQKAPAETALRSFYDPPRIGVFIDNSDPELAQALDLEMLAEQALKLPDISVAGLDLDVGKLNEVIGYYRLTHIIAGVRSNRHDICRYDSINGVPVTTVSLGGMAVFAHQSRSQTISTKVQTLLNMAVAQARGTRSGNVQIDRPDPRVVVLGGGLAGLTAAQNLSSMGMETCLVERSDRLGGWMVDNGNGLTGQISTLIDRVNNSPYVTVYLNSKLVDFNGRPGHMWSTLSTPDGEIEIPHGALVVTIGARENHPAGFENTPTITQSEFGELIAGWRKTAKLPASVVILQCAGMRQGERLYCSKTCCIDALQHAIALKQLSSATQVVILYRDIVTPGFAESLYTEARRLGVVFLRYTLDAPPQINGRKVTVLDDVLGETITLAAGLVVLSSGIVPNLETPTVARMVGISLDADGFLQAANLKSQPVDLPRPGMYVAGLAGGPATMVETIEQGHAAALRAALFLRRESKTPISVAGVNERLCSGCGLCLTVCPVGAHTIDEEAGVALVDPWLCLGCGACAAICPNGASSQTLFEAPGVFQALEMALA